MGNSKYEAVPEDDNEEATMRMARRSSSLASAWLPFYTITGAFLATTLVILYLWLGPSQSIPISPSTTCSQPAVRLEWRSLWRSEQQSYIAAALCLQNIPSVLTGKGTLNDDFVYVHHKAGSLSHKSAAFLTWHRAFVHIYEQTLQQRCGYDGPLPYWNWELDWIAIDKSEVFNNITGFGGDGNPSYELGPGDGWCVTDGPWANSQRIWFEGAEKPHCMGRRFMYARTNGTGGINGEWYSPEKMGMVHRAPDYQEFRAMIEGTVHNGLHWSIRGDFASLTAANGKLTRTSLDVSDVQPDPLFWLHHAQLDRLWWQWQQQDPKTRLFEYWGLPEETDWPSQDSWALEDMLEFAGLWEEIQVIDVMDTRSGLLCYRY